MLLTWLSPSVSAQPFDEVRPKVFRRMMLVIRRASGRAVTCNCRGCCGVRCRFAESSDSSRSSSCAALQQAIEMELLRTQVRPFAGLRMTI